jgi:2-hydroxy-4-carboxymuconate semialdehyde hemiacetal dehydrogenase
MAGPVKVVLVGEGRHRRQHAAALARIDASTVGPGRRGRRATAASRRRARRSPATASTWRRSSLTRWIAADPRRPTPLHASAGLAGHGGGKHVLVEIPMADTPARTPRRVVAPRQRTGVTAHGVPHRRVQPEPPVVHRASPPASLTLQHLVVETFFFRREQPNALGQPRSWTDHLLWHHACHTVDLFMHQTGEVPTVAWAQQGPPHPSWASPWT